MLLLTAVIETARNTTAMAVEEFLLPGDPSSLPFNSYSISIASAQR